MYGLADCNNFYASCERVFNPSLIGRPVIVLSNNDGCVIARSNEAKALGVRMGDPFFELRDLIRRENIAVYSSNFALYGDMSARVMNLLKSFVPATEVYSIDEAFLDFTGMDETALDRLGHEISRTINRHTGIPISLGIAPTKTLAKIASKLCKQYPKLDGCCFMHRQQDIEKVLRKYPIGNVWGIGHRYEKKLQARGIDTAYGFTQQSPEWVQKHMTVAGLRTWMELRGVPCIGFEEMPPQKQQICTSRSFAKEISDPEELRRDLTFFASTCAEKLRKQQSVCSEVRVFILTNPFRPDAPQYYESTLMKLSVPTDSTLQLVKYVGGMLDRIYRKGYAYKKGGVILSDIQSNDAVQNSLFEPVDRAKHSRVMEVMDYLNGKHGRNMLSAACAFGHPYQMNRQYLSPKYTTDWNDIIRVK